MIEPQPRADWPALWREAYAFDRVEVFGEAGARQGHALAYQQRLDRTLQAISARAAPGARIIDVAAAQGNFSLRLAEAGFDVTWNDLRADLEGYVRRKYEHGAISYLPGDAFALGDPGLFDVVLITEIIEHVAHPDRFLANVAKLLRPGGFVYMTTPNGEYLANRLPKFSDCPDPEKFESVQFQPDGDGHIFLLHSDEIPPLARMAGLDVQSLDLFTSFLLAGRLRTEPLLRLMPGRITKMIDRYCERLPAPLARKVLVQMAVCMRKPIDPPEVAR
jgi:2-polyprenyl-6-hydroxyphenyl methylase/3-demethylubiquinone-9 3-methyltransferase